jgi:hypothetical protein
MAAPAITASDLAAVREAIGFASRRRPKDATDAQQRIAASWWNGRSSTAPTTVAVR